MKIKKIPSRMTCLFRFVLNGVFSVVLLVATGAFLAWGKFVVAGIMLLSAVLNIIGINLNWHDWAHYEEFVQDEESDFYSRFTVVSEE